jgi:hypothetical protein
MKQILLVALVTCLTCLPACAGKKETGTQYWTGPVEATPAIPRIQEALKPTPAPAPTRKEPQAAPTATARPRALIEFPQQAVVHQFSMQVGRSIPVPTAFTPTRIVNGVVIPGTPTSMTRVETGVRVNNGTTTITDISGWVDYGSSVNTPQGVVRNRMPQPVIQRIQMRR